MKKFTLADTEADVISGKKFKKKSNVCGLQCSNENQINKSWRYIRKSSVLNTDFYVF